MLSELLDAQPRLAALIQQDLLAACPHNPRTGRPGLSGDQVLRMLVARQLNGWTYAELAFHLADSGSYRTFCRVGGFGSAPSKSALAANLRRVRPQTLATLNARLLAGAAARAVETGRIVRIDSTVVPVAIHPPTDSSLLLDGVRVLLRLLRRAEHRAGFTAYHRHLKRAKRRALAIQHLAPQATGPRRAAYRELLALTQATVDYASDALAHVAGLPPTRALRRLSGKLAEMLPRVEQAIAQATCRVLHGELVPAPEKLVSLFETHTDVIVKDRRETYYGHKIFLTGGASGLILDCAIPKGNPADATWTVSMLARQGTLYGRPPRQASFDGGFASADNLTAAKALQVTDVCFSKKRGLAVLDMVKSSWVYRKLRDFRAGIESGISLLKRVFGLARCIWKGALAFQAYVRAAVLTANLLTLARHRLA
jgi:IS5 family transposase